MNKALLSSATCASLVVLYGHHQYTHSIPFLYNRARDGIVSIDSIGSKRNMMDVNGDRVETLRGSGTGFIVKSKTSPGIKIVTNYHVIEDSEKIRVHTKLSNKKDIDMFADVINIDPINDIAILQFKNEMNFENESILKPLRLCDNTTVEITPEVGESVIAIGDPYGFEKSVSSGIISGVKRSVSYNSFGRDNNILIQTDAPINPGNSGGPLISKYKNCVIGVNTGTINQASGIGFAVPSSIVKQLL